MRFAAVFLLSLVALSAHAFTLASNASGQRGWQNPTILFNVNSTNCPANIPLYDIVDTAANLWNTVSSSNLILRRSGGSSSTPASLVAGPVFDSPVIACDTNFQTNSGMNANTVSAYGQITTLNGQIAHGYILLNVQAGSAGHIGGVAPSRLTFLVAREFGHVLGLGLSQDKNAFMYFDSTAKSKLNLGKDDMDGITYLYPRNEPPDGMLGCGSTRNEQTPYQAAFSLGLLSLLLASARMGFGRSLLSTNS